jgi:hypothetical protein
MKFIVSSMELIGSITVVRKKPAEEDIASKIGEFDNWFDGYISASVGILSLLDEWNDLEAGQIGQEHPSKRNRGFASNRKTGMRDFSFVLFLFRMVGFISRLGAFVLMGGEQDNPEKRGPEMEEPGGRKRHLKTVAKKIMEKITGNRKERYGLVPVIRMRRGNLWRFDDWLLAQSGMSNQNGRAVYGTI